MAGALLSPLTVPTCATHPFDIRYRADSAAFAAVLLTLHTASAATVQCLLPSQSEVELERVDAGTARVGADTAIVNAQWVCQTAAVDATSS
jgi:hypothetical protein